METSQSYPKACVSVHSYTKSHNIIARLDNSGELLSHCDNKRTANLGHFKNQKDQKHSDLFNFFCSINGLKHKQIQLFDGPL